MKWMLLFFLIAVIYSSCKEECEDGFTTVADLDSQDPVRCNKDQEYVLMKYFSGGFDSIRKARGIPSLPKDFMSMMSSFPNQLRWYNSMRGQYRKEGKPHYSQKDIEWEDSILTFDRSNFEAADSMEAGILITYKRRTVMNNIPRYGFEYQYYDKTFQPGAYRNITKEQADSIVDKWNLHY